ncbi:hypothetical protein PCA31118_01685 [Pandoraea captiosa]|uniref:Uncharacterized protein n=1 Tax=Pandoraea captiosa TaxID=2508302 RepID=A0A5E4ZV36_9BURK|nr:hypothetical protein [Pandoraea captiosa]VVE64667.1 hypothetical protein PCA31118_01685 [Pandoraea captiosa]
MTKLAQLLSRCRYGVFLNINAHRDQSIPIETWLDSLSEEPGCAISATVRRGVVESGNLVDLQCYPHNALDGHHIVHFDVDVAVELALASLGTVGAPHLSSIKRIA